MNIQQLQFVSYS